MGAVFGWFRISAAQHFKVLYYICENKLGMLRNWFSLLCNSLTAVCVRFALVCAGKEKHSLKKT